MKSPGFIFTASLGGLGLQALAYLWLVRGPNVTPASPAIAYWFAFTCIVIFYWIPLVGVFGGVSALRLFQSGRRIVAATGLAANLALLVGGGLWSLHGL